ncbi:ATP-grasp domain-containing protein [Lacrimispora sp.]|uniref:ATP-grasp domain-containing protein n=1 Tax=Lacrimispora sp. TaxID=2719234 RepID=UPI0039E33C4E
MIRKLRGFARENKSVEKINVLVLGVGGNVSQGIIKAILMSKLNVNIVGACINSDSLGLYMCDTAYLSPLASDEKFIPWLINICQNENIHMILTGVEEVIEKISTNYEYMKLYTKANFLFTPYEKLMIGQDKLSTCEWLRHNNCNYPLYCSSNDAKGLEELIQKTKFPLIAKPRKGKGSQGIFIINDYAGLAKLKDMPDYVVQEYIGNESSEYTVGCYCDRHGELIEIIIMHRELKYGTTFKASVVEHKQIREEAVKICDKFRPIGPLNIQFRIDQHGRPVCFELNVRFSGTTPMRAYFGYNDVEAMIREYILNEDIRSIFHIKKGTAYRYFDEMYIDESMKYKLEQDKVVENTCTYNNIAIGYGRGSV